MNDNLEAASQHHAECLRLLNDLHDLMCWVDWLGVRIDTEDPATSYALDFGFWEREIANVLAINGRALNTGVALPVARRLV